MAKTDQPGAGMEKAELRTHVKFARRKPVHIAFALGGDGKAVVMMDKRKPPRAIVRDLKEQSEESRNHRFGSMMFDPENPKLAIITVNKASTGMARKLMIAFKGTGVRQIQIMTEDGEAVETAQSDEDAEDEEQDDGSDDEDGSDEAVDRIADAVSHTAADVADTLARFFGDRDGSDRPELSIKARYEGTQPDVPPATDDSADTGADEADGEQPEYDAEALTADLVGLVKRMMDAIKQDPAQKAGLAELATDAQASLKRGDLPQASAGIEVLRLALDGIASPGANSVPVEEDAQPSSGAPASEEDQFADAQAPADGVGAKAVQRYRKSRAVWVATRAKIDADIKKLSDTILALDHGGAFGDDLEQNFLNTIDPILSTLDDSLADILTAAEKATSADETARALDQARTTIGLYQNFVQSDGTIKELDQNPFMPMAIAKTLNASLQVLSAAMK